MLTTTGGSGWDYENRQAFSIHSGPLSCMCEVEGKLWIGSENFCFIFNLSTKTVEVWHLCGYISGLISSGLYSCL